MILSIDLGTSLTKVGLWTEDGLAGLGRSRLETLHRHGGWAEQDPLRWWVSVKEAARQAFSELPRELADDGVEAIGFSAARQSLVPVDSSCRPLGNALLWNDRRATSEAAVLIRALGGVTVLRERTGTHYDSGSVAAKLAWLARHEPARLSSARWLLAPRDAVVFELTGEVATDVTLASASGLYDSNGLLVTEILQAALAIDGDPAPGIESLMSDPGALLPPPLASDRIVGELLADAAAQLGLAPGIPVIVGAGDRQCEVLGAGASVERPMVSWGTTANVSMPIDTCTPGRAAGLSMTRSAGAGWLLEGGLSGAGSLLEWISGLLGSEIGGLVRGAAQRPPGAHGVLVLPWLGGARAPWWCPAATAAVLGLSTATGPFDVTRAALEGVAYDIVRCLGSAYAQGVGAARPDSLVLGGSGASVGPWVEILTAIAGVPATRRRSGEAASAGAALLAAGAVGIDLDLDSIDPVVEVLVPDPTDVAAYERLRPLADRLAASSIASAWLGRPD